MPVRTVRAESIHPVSALEVGAKSNEELEVASRGDKVSERTSGRSQDTQRVLFI